MKSHQPSGIPYRKRGQNVFSSDFALKWVRANVMKSFVEGEALEASYEALIKSVMGPSRPPTRT